MLTARSTFSAELKSDCNSVRTGHILVSSRCTTACSQDDEKLHSYARAFLWQSTCWAKLIPVKAGMMQPNSQTLRISHSKDSSKWLHVQNMLITYIEQLYKLDVCDLDLVYYIVLCMMWFWYPTALFILCVCDIQDMHILGCQGYPLCVSFYERSLFGKSKARM